MKRGFSIYFCFIFLLSFAEVAEAQQDTVHRITFEQATKYISNYLGKETFRDYAHKFAFGGQIPKGYLETKSMVEDTQVVNFYPCFDHSLFGSRTFIAYASGEVPTPEYCGCLFKTGVQAYESGNGFTYESDNIGPDDIESFINSLVVTDEPASVPISNEKITDYSSAFKVKYNTQAEGSTDAIDNCAYFTKEELKEILTYKVDGKPFEHIVYFFGYDKNHARNKIRLILAGVINGEVYKVVMWEKSWPPGNCKPNVTR